MNNQNLGSITAIVFSKKEEKRLEDLFTQFSKTELNTLKFNEFFLFCLDRQIITPIIPFSTIYDLFLDCLKTTDVSGKERSLNREEFDFILKRMAKMLYPHEKGREHIERLFQEVLAEKTVSSPDGIQQVRIPQYDDTTKKILSEASFRALCDFEDDLRSCFIAYINENYQSNRILLTWKEIALQNKKMTVFSFIRFLKEANIIPNCLSIENVHEVLTKIVPPIIQKEYEFYQKHRPAQMYDKDIGGIEQKYEGDPFIGFHEFQLLMARLAVEERKNKEEKSELDLLLKNFFQNVLGIRRNQDVESENLPSISKKFQTKLGKYYEQLKQEQASLNKQQEQREQEEEDLKDPMELLRDLQNKNIFQVDPIVIDVQDIYNVLNKELPQIPAEKTVQQENPPPYKFQKVGKKQEQIKVVIGDPIPDPPKDKNSNSQKAKPPKKQQLKKGEKPPRAIIFAGFPQPPPKMGFDHLEKLNEELVYGEKNLTEVERGTMSDIEVIPIILEEIIYPPKCLDFVRHLIESAIQNYNTQNYYQAMVQFDEAKKKWHDNDDGSYNDQIILFFEYIKASLYMSAGRDDYALHHFMQSKFFSDKLNYTNPDRSLGYCGLGSVLFNTEEYKMSLRCFLKSREIREKLLGSEHVDTATCYNNLGCCMFMLERNNEAIAYFKIAHAIFECELGNFHNRTLTAARNIKKAEKGAFKNVPEFKTLWENYEEDPFKKKKKPKGGKKKK